MINREFFILPETFTLPGLDGKGVTIKAPVCHVGERPLMARLMSSDLRQGQMLISDDDPGKTFKLPDKVLEKSPVLIFHAHGGGFVAQSSKACDIYLTEWAKELQLPLLSIDYTLAPEGPYPRAVEEVFYAYCWALRYPHKLGWTGEKILLVGDSAGGNLIFGVAFQAFMEGIRMPNGLVAIYPPFLAQYTPSPSRLLALMDPLIPMGILTRCLAAYAGLPETTDVGMVQGVDNDSPDSSPSNESVGSWDQMSPSELKGAEDMFSINSPSDDDASIRAKERLKEEQAQAAIRANQRGFSFHVPVANHLYSLALPVTSRVSGGVSRVKDVVTSGIRGARSLIASPSPETAGNPRRRSKSVINPTAPWTKMMNPLKRYNFAMVPVNDPLLSPLQADDVLMRSLPPVSIIAAHLDPFLDDSIAFAKKLRAANKLTSLDILPHLPHGFLNFVLVGEKPRQGNRLVMRRINEMLTDGLGLHL